MNQKEEIQSDKCFEGLFERVRDIVSRHDALILGLGVLLLWSIWALFFAPLGVTIFCEKGEDDCKFLAQLGQIGDLFGGINALFAALAFVGVALSTDHARRVYKEERQIAKDAIFVKQVQQTYEWAYDVFSEQESKGRSDDVRLAWLTAARHLVRAQQIAELVKSDAFRLILEEHTEYWRRRFFKALESLRVESKGDLATSFFGTYKELAQTTKPSIRVLTPVVHLGSAEIIIAFSQWNESREDPVDWAEKNGNFDKAYEQGIGRDLSRYKELLNEQKVALADKSPATKPE